MNINPMQLIQDLNRLKAKGGDPNQMIQQMLNSGRITQSQYNDAVQRANQLMSMLTPGGRR